MSLRAVRSLMELHEQDAVVAMEVQSVMPKHLGNQRVADLQALTHGETHSPALRDREIHYPKPRIRAISFLLSTGAQSPPTSPVSRPPVLGVRVEAGPGAGRHCCAAESAGFVEMCVHGCEAELLTSTVNMLGPFMEDELNSDAQPIRITVHNTHITLKVRGRGCWSLNSCVCAKCHKVMIILSINMNAEQWRHLRPWEQ